MAPAELGERVVPGQLTAAYCNAVYSLRASIKIGMSESASFQMARKS